MTSKEIAAVVEWSKTATRDELAEKVDKLCGVILSVQMDLDRAECIINGSWPDADECITLSRKKVPNADV